MRAIANLSIEFLFVALPVRLYAATDSTSRLERHRLHEACHTRIQLRPWCPADRRQLEPREIVPAVEVARDQYVVLTDDDVEALPVATKRRLKVEQFVPADEARAATRFVKATYYAAPDGLASAAFQLFYEVLAARGLVALGRVVIRDRERLAALEPCDGVLLVSTLAWPEEVRSAAGLRPSVHELLREQERDLALQIADAMTRVYEPAAYQDTYSQALAALVQSKLDGGSVATPPVVPESPAMVDLMAALKASMAELRDAPKRRRRTPAAARARGSAA